jgi:hypothetical protein
MGRLEFIAPPGVSVERDGAAPKAGHFGGCTRQFIMTENGAAQHSPLVDSCWLSGLRFPPNGPASDRTPTRVSAPRVFAAESSSQQ